VLYPGYAVYLYPENSTLTITLTVNGQELVLTDDMLTLGRAGHGHKAAKILVNQDPARYENTAQWVLGELFMEKYCVGFDYGSGKIGISERK
jgi:hypothetical protein